MEISSIGAPVTISSPAGDLSRAGLDQQDFLKILLTQLTFQDPLEPMDNQEFVSQMAQFTSLDQSRQTNEKLDTLLTMQASSQSLALIGKTVNVNTSTGSQSGTVTTVFFANGVPELNVNLGGSQGAIRVSLSQVQFVR